MSESMPREAYINQAYDLITSRRAEPSIHENGFIQVPLNPDRTIRLHVWPDGHLQRQATVNTIHDHRFDFRSYILAGRLVHIEYDWTSGVNGKYLAWLANTCGTLERDWFGDVTERSENVFTAGSHYTFGRSRFHDTYGVGLTTTLMFKTGNDPAVTPRILCLRDEPPDNTYDRTIQDPGLVWNYLDRALARLARIDP